MLFAIVAVSAPSYGCTAPSTQSYDGSYDGAALGTPYGCGSDTAICVVGRSYCRITPSKALAGTPSYMCLTTVPSDGGLGLCSDAPNCACLCTRYLQCGSSGSPCTCDDSNGIVVLTCNPV